MKRRHNIKKLVSNPKQRKKLIDGASNFIKAIGKDGTHIPRRHKHSWSGWPGAHCLKCGAEHALEIALADNWYDPVTDTWDTEEHEKIVLEADGYCPVGEEDA